MIPMIYNLVYRNRLIKEQEKTERQEAVRREREIRNQQLLEVSQTIYHFRVSFTFVSILLFHSQKTVLLLYLGYLTFFVFCPYVVRDSFILAYIPLPPFLLLQPPPPLPPPPPPPPLPPQTPSLRSTL
ncbi:mucin-17-like isoform X1 [Vespula maculifrons]|uniref:Mucin-17-like isoform X1 n=1 Tax=Vespula maculifrons TaxID=7453 RepID=A0ABD2CMR3_VESMC